MLLRIFLILTFAVCARADWTPFQADLGPRLRLSDAERDDVRMRQSRRGLGAEPAREGNGLPGRKIFQ